MGVGNFFGLLPDSMADSRLYGVELDSITGRIAQKLYPEASIKVAGFETTDRRDFYDLAVGNVPFGNYKVNDKAYNKLGFSIHNYFFAKAIDQVRPGGVVAFVTSRYTLDSKDSAARKHIAERADLLGAIRLPNNAFRANAGTDVVSDIIFLQKRDRPMDHEPAWVQLGKTADGIAINSYFADHPEMILGKLTTESTKYGKEEATVVPIEGANLADQLREAVQQLEGQYLEAAAEVPDIAETEAERRTLPADPDVKNFSYTVVEGDVYYRENSVMTQVELSGNAKDRVVGMVELRQIVNELIDRQLNDYPEEDIKEAQEQLNAAYDAFTAQYGLLNDRKNGSLFEDDSSYYLLCSLENLDEQGQLKSKADMFTQRTIRPERVITSVNSPSEALAVSIGEHGKVDLPYMAELLGTPGEYAQITGELSGVIFKDPNADPADPEAGWQMADEYLSGDVRTKLRTAQLAAETNPEFAVNAEALLKAQPKDLEASEIDVRLGATWLAPEIIQKFMAETFQIPYYMRHSINVKFSQRTAEWRIEGKTAMGKGDIMSCETYGTSRANAYKILEETLNLKDVRIYDTIEDDDGKPKRVLNKRETMLAQQKQQSIKDAFANWIWQDPQRRISLVRQYNELFNSTRPREYNGEHIHFVGMNPEISLREHQRNAIAHVLYGGNTLLAHEVGAGKTFEMAASAMEAKRLGLCQKSLFVVPNHLTEQWAAEFLHLYPNGNCLDTAIATNMIAVGMDVDRLGLMVVTGQPKQNSEYIQATSRIGRSYPGLVVTLYNPYRPRDLSHYENFTGYHAQLYRFVEGTTATPFSARARDRVLHALVISAIRLHYPEFASNDGAAAIDKLTDEQLNEVKALIMNRLNIIKPSAKADAEHEIDDFISNWKLLATQSKGLRYYVYTTKTYNRLMNTYGEVCTDLEKPTLRSMRDVESAANMFYYTED